ncbi:MAG: PQQ-binding-like beta-propeller repeat protein [Pirellulaceae bacterium]
MAAWWNQRSTFWMGVGVWTCCAASIAAAADWPRFRGPNGSGTSPDPQAPPTSWSPTERVKWKVALPGPGSSSPIVAGNRIFLTCWSGYGVDQEGGRLEDLRRHLVCIDRRTGAIQWKSSVAPDLPEDRYGGMFAQHGYASHTPVTDGEHVYAYFGKSGAVAYDMDGKLLWQKKLGTELDPRGWGSASSPILFQNLLIVTASAESEALVALDKRTGEQVWRQEASGLNGTWGTPVLVEVDASRTDLVLGVPGEVWGFNPETGKLRWYCQIASADQYCASVVAADGVIYALEARGGGSTAIRAGGDGDVTSTHVLWQGKDANRISSPVVHEGRVYLVAGRVFKCLDAKTGDRLYQERLVGTSGEASAGGDASGGRAPGETRVGFGGRGGFGRGGGPGGSVEYASPILAGGKIYITERNGDVFVVAARATFEQLAVNRVAAGTDDDYSATPAASNGELFLRSSRYLYCISEK